MKLRFFVFVSTFCFLLVFSSFLVHADEDGVARVQERRPFDYIAYVLVSPDMTAFEALHAVSHEQERYLGVSQKSRRQCGSPIQRLEGVHPRLYNGPRPCVWG